MKDRREAKRARLPPDDLGELGETRFQSLCAAAGIAAHRVGRDKYGWDMLVEVPVAVTRPRVGMGETDPPIRTCKVQVKTTQQGEKTPGAKLSNWAIMAREPYPWFILHIVVERKRVVGIRIAHIGKPLVERALEKVFFASDAGKSLNQVRWSCGSKHFEPVRRTGSALLKAMRSALGESSASYAAAKESWRNGAGYGANKYTLAFSTTSDAEMSATEKLTKLMTGEVDSLAPEKVTLFETRFGVKVPLPTGGPDATHKLTIQKLPSIGLTRVSLTRRSTGECVEHECETYSASAVIPGLTQGQDRVRLVAEGFIVLVAPDAEGNRALRIESTLPDLDKPSRLLDLVRRCRTFSLLTAPDSDEISLEFLRPGGKPFSLLAPRLRASAQDERRAVAHVVHSVARVCSSFDVAMDFEVIPRDLMRDARSWAVLAAGVANRPADIQRLTFGRISPPIGDVGGKRAAFLVIHSLHLGRYFISAVLSLEGRPVNLPDERIELQKLRVRIWSRYRTTLRPTAQKTLVADCVNAKTEILADGFDIVILPDLAVRRRAKASR